MTPIASIILWVTSKKLIFSLPKVNASWADVISLALKYRERFDSSKRFFKSINVSLLA